MRSALVFDGLTWETAYVTGTSKISGARATRRPEWTSPALHFAVMATPGERIEQERLRQGLSREELSEQLGGYPVPKTIERIEKGIRPNSKLRFLLEEHLGIDVADSKPGGDVNEDVVLRSVSDEKFYTEALRRALLRSEPGRRGAGDTQSSRSQPKRGRRAVAPREIVEPNANNQANLDE